ncbi:glycosyl hydrolase [Vibrio tritonius]|uniref:glycosyl hydrolase n=1 Tax=Vibrio tritonius TaxID=1435069 RepID=UPI00083845A3|nr:glycosyl hydrolase [Vibrio tritonius]
MALRALHSFFITALISLITNSAFAEVISTKRGLAYSGLQPADLTAMNEHIAWWYNWAEVPEESAGDNATQYGVEYVPMALNATFDETAMRSYLSAHPEVKYLLAFNEPNFTDQANLTPQQAADAWPALEAIADDYDLKIVGPAMNYSAGEVDLPDTDDDGSPFAYLDAFFAACSDCRVDYIAIHSYMGSLASFEWYVNEFYTRYNKPIWVTEWNYSNDSTSLENQMDYLAQTVRWMEQQAFVFRYAWFIGRTTGGATTSPFIDILSTTAGEWTALGSIYQGIPGADYYPDLPATLQAEHAYTMTGMHHRATTDSTGAPIVQLFSDQDDSAQELSFQVNSNSDNTYNLSMSYATGSNSYISIQVDDNSAQNLFLPNTGGVYFWETATTSLYLSSGHHTISIKATSGYPGFDWFKFE